jgi:hypothetical protein
MFSFISCSRWNLKLPLVRSQMKLLRGRQILLAG